MRPARDSELWRIKSRPADPRIKNWPVEQGEFFTLQDVKAATKVCVLGKTVAEKLFGGQSPVGHVIRIKRIPFRVLGVLSPKGQTAFGQDQDDTIVVPYTTAQKRLMGIPGTNSGRPASSKPMRATLIPCSASGMAQPMMTSAISCRSSCG